MTCSAVFGCGLVEKDRLTGNKPRQTVTLATPDVTVRPLQWKRGALVMVEQRRFPAGAVVAVGTKGIALDIGELSAVNVLVAPLAFLGSNAEIHIL